MLTKVLKCTEPKCTNEYQETKYGPNMRVFNMLVNNNKDIKTRKFRCTVCGKERDD